jgi:hypothetical protein
VPKALDEVCTSPLDYIAYEPQTAFYVKYRSAMRYRVGQPAVSVMAAGKEIKGLAVPPGFGSYIGDRIPGERTFGDGLIDPVYPDRIVGAGATEKVALVSVGDITIGAGIDQKALSVKGKSNAQGVGMTMTRAPYSLRSGIYH